MLGFDVISAFFILLNIIMIVVDTLGFMYLWGVDFNAISLVNLTMVSYGRFVTTLVVVERVETGGGANNKGREDQQNYSCLVMKYEANNAEVQL